MVRKGEECEYKCIRRSRSLANLREAFGERPIDILHAYLLIARAGVIKGVGRVAEVVEHIIGVQHIRGPSGIFKVRMKYRVSILRRRGEKS